MTSKDHKIYFYPRNFSLTYKLLDEFNDDILLYYDYKTYNILFIVVYSYNVTILFMRNISVYFLLNIRTLLIPNLIIKLHLIIIIVYYNNYYIKCR